MQMTKILKFALSIVGLSLLAGCVTEREYYSTYPSSYPRIHHHPRQPYYPPPPPPRPYNPGGRIHHDPVVPVPPPPPRPVPPPKPYNPGGRIHHDPAVPSSPPISGFFGRAK